MKEEKSFVRNGKIVVICAVAFFCVTMPFRSFAALTGSTEVRPASALPPVCGLLFGVWGALGCALGNLIADLLCGYDVAIAMLSFFIQFAASYIFYVLWYGQFFKKDQTQKALCPSLNRVSNVVWFGVCVCVNAMITAAMIGCLLEILSHDNVFGNTTILIFFNQVVFGILLGLPLLTLLIRSKIPIIIPQNIPYKKGLVSVSNIFLALSALCLAFCIIYRLLDNDTPVAVQVGQSPFMFHASFEETIVFLAVYIGAIIFILLGLLLKPLKFCESVERKLKAGQISINETMIFTFTLAGVALTFFVGVMGYIRLAAEGCNTVELWERLYMWVSGIIIFYFIVAIWILRAMEKKVTVPIEAISEVVSQYNTDNHKESGELIVKECKKFSENENEIGKMSKSIKQMITDIEIYTEDIKIKTAERQRMVAALDIAAKIQLGIVPHNFEDFVPMNIDIFADMTPAKMVGGDFYDFFRITDTEIGVVIGDVSGKGVPAALFMSMTKMLIEMPLMSGKTTAEALTFANKYLCGHNNADMFVTVFAAVYDTQSHRLTYSNAGHNPPLIFRDGKFSFLKSSHGLMMGSLDFIVYKEEQMSLNENEMFFLYTDGVTEANNQEQTLFGEERLMEVLNRNTALKAKEIIDTVKKSVYAFSDGMEQFDDMTMVLMRVGQNI